MDVQELIRAIDLNCIATINLTSKSTMIQRGAPPPLDKLLMQIVANDVVLMQALGYLLELLSETPAGPPPPEAKTN